MNCAKNLASGGPRARCLRPSGGVVKRRTASPTCQITCAAISAFRRIVGKRPDFRFGISDLGKRPWLERVRGDSGAPRSVPSLAQSISAAKTCINDGSRKMAKSGHSGRCRTVVNRKTPSYAISMAWRCSRIRFRPSAVAPYRLFRSALVARAGPLARRGRHASLMR